MTGDEITAELIRLQDIKYGKFQSALIPSADQDSFIGVRTPELRNFAKELYRNGGAEVFLKQLPHRYFDENQLHAFIISQEKNFDLCVSKVERFLPYVDNWATCDQMSPKAFAKEPEKLLEHIGIWICSEHTYTVRFAIGMLMRHFLDDKFKTEYADMVAGVRSEEYYINMMIAWYFATALAKQYEAIIPYMENRRLKDWTHRKAIQKSVESYRISPERKAYLKSLK